MTCDMTYDMKCDMKRLMRLASVVALFCGLGLAQQAPAKPAPSSPYDGILGPQLIAWSEMQKPQPVPQRPDPLPPPDTTPSSKPSPASQDPAQDAPKNPHSETESPAATSVTGTIVIMAGKYALETTDHVTYQLDDQDKAKAYDGKTVKVTGTLDRTSGTIHVRSIELLS
jgi:hypothetical protein